MPDTFFTATPHWAWWIVFYFFIGGIAGSSFLLSSLLYLFGRPDDRPLARLGYLMSFVGVAVSGLLLTVDLDRPERFWHMLIESNTGAPMFKPWVPMSVGSWGLMLFGLFSFLAALVAASEEWPGLKPLQWAPVRALRTPRALAVIAVLGSIFGMFLAGYTGVLLSVTNRPFWADSTLLGILFIVSGTSTGAAALLLLAMWRRAGHPASIDWLSRFDRQVLVLELLVLVLFVASLGSVAWMVPVWWGAILMLGVIGLGILVPLVLERNARFQSPGRLAQAACLVLLGGFLLRVVVLMSSNEIHALGSGVTGR
jgi:formate-dependent nitrite reductase membrane component NrfD